MFVRYVIAKVKEWAEERAYRTYVTDVLKAMCDNTAKTVNGGESMTIRFMDLLNKSYNESSNKTGDEIAAEVINNAGLKVVIAGESV